MAEFSWQDMPVESNDRVTVDHRYSPLLCSAETIEHLQDFMSSIGEKRDSGSLTFVHLLDEVRSSPG
jgi:hypothetical protein